MRVSSTCARLSFLRGLDNGPTVVCDSSDSNTIAKYKLQEATTISSFILAASKKPEYAKLMEPGIAYGKEDGKTIDERVDATLDRLLVKFGKEILAITPSKVSTEVDARFSCDVQGSIKEGQPTIGLYKSIGIPKERMLIKVVSTWKESKLRNLHKQGINYNLTIMFSRVQAITAAEADTFLTSPFRGCLLEWHKATMKKASQQLQISESTAFKNL